MMGVAFVLLIRTVPSHGTVASMSPSDDCVLSFIVCSSFRQFATSCAVTGVPSLNFLSALRSTSHTRSLTRDANWATWPTISPALFTVK